MEQKIGQRLSIGRLFGLCGVGFLVLASYSIVRPPAESLFLEAFGSESLPSVWLAVAVATLIAVTLYNRYAATVELTRLFAGICTITCALLVLIMCWKGVDRRMAIFALYVWKDTYIVILVEIFWTFANSVFETERARWIYGFFLVVGTLGSATGNLAVGRLVARTPLTSADAIWFVIPVLLLAAAGFVALCKDFTLAGLRQEQLSKLADGFLQLKRSRYVALLVLLVCLTQIVITLVDYQYNGMLETAYPDTDKRTEITSLVYSSIDVAAISLQLASGAILRLLGVGGTLLLIPLLLAGTLIAFAAIPRFLTVVVSKVASKAFDYSIFRAAKELLYIPLTYREKTQGKALVDMLSYRLAKAAASILLLALIALGSAPLVTGVVLLAVAGWVFVTLVIVRRFRAALKGEPTQV